jgi:VanZ family protein
MRLPVVARLLLPLTIMAVLWWSSSRVPTPREPSVMRAFLHNGMHVVAYAALAGSWLLALLHGGVVSARMTRAMAASFLLSVAYGAVDEWHQSFVRGRVCSISDLMTDAAGAMLALLVLRSQLGAGRLSWQRLMLWVSICVACVAFATFGPW